VEGEKSPFFIMAIKLTTTDVVSEFVKVLVFGDSGVGKTVLAATAPSPIIISAERGLLSIAGTSIPVLEVSTLEELYEAYEYVTGEEGDIYKTICLDSVSEIAEVMLATFKKENKDGRQAYGKLNDDMLELIRAFRDIDDKHVYFIAKQARIEDSASGVAKYKAMMPGRTLVQQLPYLFDEILCLRIGEDEEGEKYRYIQTQPSVTHDAKDRSGKLDDPERPDLTKMFDKMTDRSGDKDGNT